MCIQCEPENDHSCCQLSADLILFFADQQHITIPKLRARKVAHHLYAVWKDDDVGTARRIGACCAVNAKTEYTTRYVVIDKAEIELNRMYALEDPRELDECLRLSAPTLSPIVITHGVEHFIGHWTGITRSIPKSKTFMNWNGCLPSKTREKPTGMTEGL